ncbi:MAG TPA: alpha-amylase, partial [Verrucomicrobiae bacterium]|nr:alpha-amylase [Verrucomicrobiae bacterium]
GNPTAQNFILIQWQPDEAGFDLVAVNYAPHRGQCFVPLRLPTLPAAKWVVKDRMSAEEYVRADGELRAGGFYLDLAPFGAHVFNFKPVD